MKIAVIGGGGVRSMLLAKSLAVEAEALGLTELALMDTDEKKLDVFGGMAMQALNVLAPGVQCVLTRDAARAVEGARYVITTIRVGGDEARALDERIEAAHGIIGQETTGAGGFAMAMRSIPALSSYCALIKAHAEQNAAVFNFTNPAGLVTQALRDIGYDFAYGVCDAPSGILRQLSRLLNADISRLDMDVVGLNHLSYFTRVTLDGEDITQRLLFDPALYEKTDMRYFEPELAQRLHCLLNEYLYYYYYREKAEKNICGAEATRGESIRQINEEMCGALTSLDPERDFTRMLEIYAQHNHRREAAYMATETATVRDAQCAPAFDLYAPEEGGYAGVAMTFIRARELGQKGRMTLCVPNEGAVDFLLQDDVIEISCDLLNGAAIPRRTVAPPPSGVALIRQMKAYERMAVKAILTRDCHLAEDALMANPLVSSYSLARSLVRQFVRAHAAYIERW